MDVILKLLFPFLYLQKIIVANGLGHEKSRFDHLQLPSRWSKTARRIRDWSPQYKIILYAL